MTFEAGESGGEVRRRNRGAFWTAWTLGSGSGGGTEDGERGGAAARRTSWTRGAEEGGGEGAEADDVTA